MKRAALTGFISDPYITLLFKKSFDIWRDEVDQLLVCLHGGIDEIDRFNASVFEKDEKCYTDISDESFGELGLALDYLYPKIGKDVGVLITVDSDNFIFKKGIIERYASKIGPELDVIGSPGLSANRGTTADVIAPKNHGFVRFNTFLSFWDKEKIDTLEDWSFERFRLKDGDKIEEIGLQWSGKDGWIDTMSLLTIKFLSKYKRYLKLERKDIDKSEFIHIGGLSAMTRVSLEDPENKGKTMYNRSGKYTNNTFQPSRLAWHLFAFLETVKQCPLDNFNRRYKKALYNKITASGFSVDQVMPFVENIKKLWP